MNDKLMMDNLLTATKSVCDLMMHGSIESSTVSVHNEFKNALNDCLNMQNDIYLKMASKGWYPMQNAENDKIEQTANKFTNIKEQNNQ